jgi:hypothetical protein
VEYVVRDTTALMGNRSWIVVLVNIVLRKDYLHLLEIAWMDFIVSLTLYIGHPLMESWGIYVDLESIARLVLIKRLAVLLVLLVLVKA